MQEKYKVGDKLTYIGVDGKSTSDPTVYVVSEVSEEHFHITWGSWGGGSTCYSHKKKNWFKRIVEPFTIEGWNID